MPLSSIQGARRTEWPFYYGLGAKLSPRNGVAYVGSTEGVVEVRLREPQRLNVWGPFRREAAERIVVSLEDPEAFLTSLEHALERHRTGSA